MKVQTVINHRTETGGAIDQIWLTEAYKEYRESAKRNKHKKNDPKLYFFSKKTAPQYKFYKFHLNIDLQRSCSLK